MAIERARLIKDEPAAEDEFFGAGHQRSAQALSEAVRQLADRDAAIGLEGAWGSGKSTVINLAAKTLANNSDTNHYRVFTFDLWLHNPEILKLAFLEEFIAWAKKEKLLKPKLAEEFNKRIADKEISTRIENKREFNWGGIVFIALFPLLPLAYTWLSPLAFSDRVAIPAVDLPYTDRIVPLSLLAAVGLGILYFTFFVSAAFAFFGQKRKSVISALSAASRLFTKDTDFDEINQWVRERNPTSEEFQSFFREIVSKVHNAGSRVVFVFDNIDRLPSKSVQKVWSEARSIFAMASRGEKRHHSDITAIVPYDMKYISEAFEDKGEQDRPVGERAEHLIRKTFDITLRVAPPLSTDWKKFLDAKIDYAFPTQLKAADKYELFKLFDVHKQDSGLPPTPREIISYVNHVGAIWNEWGTKVPVSHMAVYALIGRNLSPEMIKNGGLVNSRFLPLIRERDVARSLAALHFNVEPEHAYQILLGQDIERDALRNDRAVFLALTKSNGFEEVFPDVVRNRAEQWARDDARQLANLVENITQEGIEGDYLREVWTHIVNAIPFVEGCDISTPEDYDGLARALGKVDKDSAISRGNQLVAWFTRHVPKPEERTELDGRSWFTFSGQIYDVLEEAFDKETAVEFQKRLPVPNGVPFYLGVCAQCAEHPSVSFNLFTRPHKAEELRATVVQWSTTAPSTLLQILRYKPWFIDDQFALTVSGSICDHLHKGLGKKELRSELVEALCMLRTDYDKKAETRPTLAARANDGTLVSHAAEALKADDKTTAARIVWLICDSTQNNAVPGNPGNHPHFGDVNPHYTAYDAYVNSLQNGAEDAQEIARLVADSGDFGRWMRDAIDDTKPPFFKAVFKSLVASEEYGALSCVSVLAGYDKMRAILSEQELAAFHNKFGNWERYFEQHFSGKDSLKIPTSLLRSIAEGKADRLKKLSELTDAYLAALSEGEWHEAFRESETELLQLLLTRLETGDFKPPLEPYRTALFDHTLAIVEGKQEEPEEAERWAALFEALRKDTREKFARDLLVKSKDIATTSDSVSAFLVTAQMIADILPITEHSDIAIDQIIGPAVLSGAPAADAFLDARSADIQSAVMKCSENVRSRLVEALESARNEREAEATAWAKQWGLKLSKKTEPEAEDSDHVRGDE